MNALPMTGELFATNQVSPETERCYKYQLRNFAQWMRENCDVEDMEDVTTADPLGGECIVALMILGLNKSSNDWINQYLLK